jgi:carbon-monoxide dehydrogenase small subunit
MVDPEAGDTIHLDFAVNEQEHSLDIATNELLLDVLRNRLGLTGAKRSCDMQVCGACTVLVDGLPVSACCMLASDVRNRLVLTIEGLASDQLHTIQRAFIEHFALQCGYCTPGMIMTVTALLSQRQTSGDLEEEDVVEYLAGSICRCTGYRSILNAVMAAAASRGETNG